MRARFLLPLGAVVVLIVVAVLFRTEGPVAEVPGPQFPGVEVAGPPAEPRATPSANVDPQAEAEAERPVAHRPVDYRVVRSALAAQPGAPSALEPAPVMPLGPPPEAWAPVPLVSPFGAGTPAPAVTRAMGALKPRLATCFEPASQATWGKLGPAFSRQGELAPPALGPAILVLEIESEGPSVRIVDAPAEVRGSASDGTLNCAQAALRGASLWVGPQELKRFRMRFPLRP